MSLNSLLNSPRAGTSWSRRRTAVLASLLSAAALVWTGVALSVHTSASAALDPDSVTNAEVARLGAGVMAGTAAVAAAMWWRHRATARLPEVGGGSARAACALSVVHSLLTVPVIMFASWGWKATAIAFICAVIAGGVREAAGVSEPTGRMASALTA